MGREFLNIFEDWADKYDDSVGGFDPQYKDVFANYDTILKEVSKHAEGIVLEFGVGTGNLTEKLLNDGKQVLGIEPSEPMRELAVQKIPDLDIKDGDFIDFPETIEPIDSIVSSYAFHHLTDTEKAEAIEKYAEMLPKNGKIVFADTMFETENAKEKSIEAAKIKGFNDLAEDLEREYYPTIEVLESIFVANNFNVSFKQMNDFVWLVIANKR
ncbi:class I SAM-dependent methyltransferase [Virgibacillus ndiopensis]|uniref:class I SAM-dependent methyltransferase n=1 Tax=Virgibacillus ndiopensis TaxID=2004408 RepID=UPI000C06C63F|nr:class I SAM-dependent methyltransferase [Virgibacillus ndiopensis]